MSNKVRPVPEGYHTLTPFLSFQDAAKAIDFYKKAFGAKEIEKHHCPQTNKIMHAVIQIGNSLIMLADEFPDHSCGISSPTCLKGTTVIMHLYVDNVDHVFNAAINAGAKEKMPVSDVFWGDRYGSRG